MAEAAPSVVSTDDDRSNTSLLESYIACAEHLIQKCKELSHIPGSGKLERKCVAELKYLKSLQRRRGGFDVTHLRSSNLSHFAGVLHSVFNLPHVTHILQAFSCPGRLEALHVDVVAGQGHIWVKVIARKAQALHLIWAGQGQYGERDIVLQAEDYVECSRAHPVNFVDPKVVFAFYNGVTSEIAQELSNRNVIVLGDKVPVDASIAEKLKHLDFDEDVSDEVESDEESSDIDYINFPKYDNNVKESLGKDNKIAELHLENYSKMTTQVESQGEQSLTNTANDDSQVCKLSSDNQSLTGTNVISDFDELSGPLFLPKTSPQNNLHRSTDANLDQLNFGSNNLQVFIRTEILVKPISDFGILESIVKANEINTLDKIGKVNLDITALITLVSAVSHGGCNFKFREKILSEQAAEERIDPVLPKLQAFLKGKIWYSCETAVESFQTILDTLGGPEENRRATELLSKVTVVPDNPSFRAIQIPTTGKIKERSKIIFGTGDSLRAVTVTANSGFVRASEHQGVTFAVFLHASRALTEAKEPTAEKITKQA